MESNNGKLNVPSAGATNAQRAVKPLQSYSASISSHELCQKPHKLYVKPEFKQHPLAERHNLFKDRKIHSIVFNQGNCRTRADQYSLVKNVSCDIAVVHLFKKSPQVSTDGNTNGNSSSQNISRVKSATVEFTRKFTRYFSTQGTVNSVQLSTA